MKTAGSAAIPSKPLWLLAELTYACPLQCPYCSNPLDFHRYKHELNTEDWLNVLGQARKMGAAQLGLSGGEPLVRRDLEIIIAEARRLGYYTNLITSGIGMDEPRIKAFKEAGLDHIQISFQASNEELNDFISGTHSFQRKLEMARLVKQYGYPMVLCFVIHGDNGDQVESILDLAIALNADYVELAAVQYYGWAMLNREHLMPTRDQIDRARRVAQTYQEKLKGQMKIYYVIPDYYEERPKACMNGWGSVFLTITPDGTALPCHAAAQLPGLSFPNVREHRIEWIWNDSSAFNTFRGFDWMKSPCKDCPERSKDFGGCRCQAYMLTGDATNADPVCSLSPHHHKITEITERVNQMEHSTDTHPLKFRNPQNSKTLSRTNR